MKDREELVKDIGNIQLRFNTLGQQINQARQKMLEARIKVDNSKIESEKLSEILDKIVNILSLEARKEIRNAISKIRRLQKTMNH